jgi:HEAT repeat protein
MTRNTWVAGAIVAALAGAWFFYAQREAARLAEADRLRAEEIRAEARAYRESDNEARVAQLDARVDAAMKQLQSESPIIRCEAAMQLGRIGTGAQIGVLTDLVYNYSELTSVRICAAGALRQMGETSTALGIYESWARDTDDQLRRSAIVGFGEIGPEAAATALPYLARELGSDFKDVRYLVVESLGRLGPTADALLADAAKDQDTAVRERAAALLKVRQTR